MDLVLKKSRSPIYLQSAQRLSNSPKLILDSAIEKWWKTPSIDFYEVIDSI